MPELLSGPCSKNAVGIAPTPRRRRRLPRGWPTPLWWPAAPEPLSFFLAYILILVLRRRRRPDRRGKVESHRRLTRRPLPF